MMKIWCISDMHNKWDKLKIPKNLDMVICAGDATTSHSVAINSNELSAFLKWFSTLPMKYKIFIPGNHETSFNNYLNIKDWPNIVFLIDKEIIVDTIKIYGSPYTPTFGNGWAFNKNRDLLHKIWNEVPNDTDILVTHGPSFGILDQPSGGVRVGDKELTRCIKRVNPRYHIFGHIHNNITTTNSLVFSENTTTFVNASVVDDYHLLQNNGKIIGI